MSVAFIIVAAVLTPALVSGLRSISTGVVTPAAIAAPVFVVEYCVRPLMVLGDGTWSPGAAVSRDIGVLGPQVFPFATLSVAAAAAGLILGLATFPRRSTRTDPPPQELLHLQAGRQLRLLPLAAMWALGAVTASAIHASAAGTGLQPRFATSSGLQLALTSLTWAPPLAVLASLRPPAGDRRLRRTLIGMVALGLVLNTVLLGGRAEAVIGVTALLVIASRMRGGISARRGILVGLALIACLSAFRIVTREDGSGWSSLTSNPINAIMRSDVNAFDKLLAIEDSDLTGSFGGSTYVAGALVAMPSSIVSWAGESGSTAYTREVLPARYANGFGFEGSSGLGEAVMNFGAVGALAFGLLFGACFQWAHRRSYGGPFALFAYAVLLGRIPGIVRGDAASVLAVLAPTLLWGWLALRVAAASITERPHHDGIARPSPAHVPYEPSNRSHGP